MEQKCSVGKIGIGSKLSETQYYTVIDVNVDNITVRNERGMEFNVSHAIVEEGMYSSDQYTLDPEHELQVTRTELIEIFRKVGDTVFTVCFNKQPDAETINNAIESLNNGKILPIKEMKKVVKEAFKGEVRILTGYLIATETGFGRSMVIDLELIRGENPLWDARIRQVDHRSLNWLIWKNTKYTVKK
jgi:hypothetical protein